VKSYVLTVKSDEQKTSTEIVRRLMETMYGLSEVPGVREVRFSHPEGDDFVPGAEQQRGPQ
jgi:hypothetical protein